MDAGYTLTIKMPDGSEKKWSVGAVYGRVPDNDEDKQADRPDAERSLGGLPLLSPVPKPSIL